MLTGLAQHWNARKLAIVRGVGYPQTDHSRFRSMDIWQTASPAEPVATGWIGMSPVNESARSVLMS
jgi:uncharacterized protein (DUF1501 family)